MLHITPINAFNDNYIWLIKDQQTANCCIVDPGDAKPVLNILAQQQLNLTAILITHHHWDHTGGIAELLQQHCVPVYGPHNPKIHHLSHNLSQDDALTLQEPKCHFKIMTTPGHTLDHIAYYEPTADALFCGDTLFTGGCGRLFEGTPEQMYHSLQKLCALPEQTMVYCAHEYTLANLQFAKLLEPQSEVLQQRIAAVTAARAKHQTTVPASLSIEKQTNPFLRCHLANVKLAAEQHCGQSLTQPHEVFAVLRAWKNSL